MRYARRALCCVVLVACCFSLAACALLPFGSSPTTPSTTTKLGSKTATGSVAATGTKAAQSATPTPKPAPAKPVNSFAKEPKPKPYDPLLASGSWGYHSLTKFEKEVSRESTLTNGAIDITEETNLTKEQRRRLLRLFRNSARVHKIIDQNDGDWTEDPSYSVVSIQSTFEGGPSVPWVTATLRATFGTRDGVKALDVFVYRMQTRFGLDERPYVGGAQVGYIDSIGTLTNPVRVKY